MRTVKAFVINTAILTATALLMRMVGVWFSVYLSNKIGASGMGLYSLILSVYGLAVTFATSGIRLASTRLVAEELGKGNEAGAKKVVRRCVAYALCFGIGTGVLLYFNAQWIGLVWLGDARTVLSLDVLAISLPFIAVSSVLSGYFVGVRRVVKNAAEQVFEQMAKITLTIGLLTVLMPYGLEYACVAIVAGACLAELVSFFFLLVLYLFDVRRYRKDRQPVQKLTRRMCHIALPVALSSYARSGLVTLEHLLIPRGLQKSGASSEAALAAYGTVHAMVMPILLFPSAFLTSVADLIIPELAACNARHDHKRSHYMIRRVTEVTLLFSIGVAGVFFFAADAYGMAIYHSAEVGHYMRIIAPLIPIMYLDTAVDGMLKGLGEEVSVMRYNIIDALISVALVYVLLPPMAVAGYIVTIYAGEIINFVLSYGRLFMVTRFRFDPVKSIFKPILGAVCAGLATGALLGGFAPSSPFLAALVPTVLMLALYLVFLLFTRGLTREDLRYFRSILR